MPYRAVVYVRSNGDTPLYAVAGHANGPWNACNALRRAMTTYRSRCFYCSETENLTIDHVDPKLRGKREDLANLVVACKPCNSRKADKPVEQFDRKGGREWLSALIREAQERLNRLP